MMTRRVALHVDNTILISAIKIFQIIAIKLHNSVSNVEKSGVLARLFAIPLRYLNELSYSSNQLSYRVQLSSSNHKFMYKFTYLLNSLDW
jgi:hypothetical protein